MTDSLALELTPHRRWMLVSFALATIFLIPANLWIVGLPALILCAILVAKDPEPRLRRRLAVLLTCVVILGLCDINPGLSDANFLQVGIPFSLALFLPLVLQRCGDDKVIRYQLLPTHWRRRDLIYTLLSVPLAWFVLKSYEWGNRSLFDDELFHHWALGTEADPGEIRRLFVGINLVGIWDELFFVNTAYALLRSLFSYRVANTLQAILYTAVLYDMAFTGCGIGIVFLFALTQGSMFEKSKGLLWVLIVHLIIDYFLVALIVQSYYPEYGYGFLWH